MMRNSALPASFLCLFLLAACGEGARGTPQSIGPAVEPAAPGEDTVPLTAPGSPVYVGVWAASSSWCNVAPASGDPSPIAITDNEFLGYENRCRIADSVEGTEGGYRVTLACVAEGVEYTDTLDLDVDGDQLRIRRPDGAEARYSRCATRTGP